MGDDSFIPYRPDEVIDCSNAATTGPRENVDSVHFMTNGKVVKIFKDYDKLSDEDKVSPVYAYGNYVIIEDKDGFKIRYAHLSTVEEGLKVGGEVKMDQQVGIQGDTGNGPKHTHISIHAPGFSYYKHTIPMYEYMLKNGRLRDDVVYPTNKAVSGKYGTEYIPNPQFFHEGDDMSGHILVSGYNPAGFKITHEIMESLKPSSDIQKSKKAAMALQDRINITRAILDIPEPKNYSISDFLLGKITLGEYLTDQKIKEKLKAEAEAKRIAEEKAAKEKAEKERQDKEKLAREDEERRKEGGNNPSPNPKKPDEDRSEPILDEDDRPGRRNKKGEKPIKSPPKKDGGGNNPPPPKNNPPPKKGGGGGGSKPKPPKIPKPGDMIPLSIDTNNEYYLGSLYGTKPFSAQESSAFNSTIISNELSALQPITSLNVAGFPVNDTAIKEEPFGV